MAKRWMGAAVLVALAAGLAAALSLAGCSEPVREDAVSVWVEESDYRSYIKDVFELYESETGNYLNVKSIPDESFDEEVAAAFESGTGPDILLHYNDSDLADVGIAEHFLMLNDQVWADTLMEDARSYCDDGEGNLVGLPFWESSVSGCYYNKALFAEMGLRPVATQVEFDMLCQAISETGRTALFWGDDCGWMYQLGLDSVFADDPELLERLNAGEIDYADIPQVRDMVQWIYDAFNNGWLGKPVGLGYNDVSKPIASGAAVMVDIWDTWFETDFKSGTYSPEDFAVMPVFLGTSRSGSYEGGNLNMMLVNKNSSRLDEAVGVLEFCANPDVYNRIFKGVPSVKVFAEQDTIVTSPMLTDAAGSIARLQRVSTAQPKIRGYSQDDMKVAFSALFKGEVDVDGCIALMDDMRKDG